MILDLEPHLVHKVSSTWIVDLNVKSKMVKHRENNRVFILRIDAKAETPILWPPHAKC